MFDCIIVGGGPAGLSAAVNLYQRGKQPIVITNSQSLLGRAERVDNHLGMPDMTGEQLLEAFAAHAAGMGVETRHAKVGNIMPMGSHFLVGVGPDILETRTVILATGVSNAKPVAGEQALLGRGVSYCATCDGMLYRGRKVAVWGLAPDAAHEANFLAEIGCEVIFIAHKRPDALADTIAFVPGGIQKIHGESAVAGVTVGGEKLAVTGVFLLRAATPPDALVPGLAVADGSVTVNRACATSIAGLFAAGDVTGKPWQLSKAVGEGLIAGQAAAEFLNRAQSAMDENNKESK